MVDKVNTILEQQAAASNLRFDTNKEASIRLKPGGSETSSVKTLGITISDNLDFDTHNRERISKATAALNTLTRLAGRKGLSPKALRAIYTGQIRPIMIYGSELWNGAIHTSKLTEPLARLQYQALRRITGAYLPWH